MVDKELLRSVSEAVLVLCCGNEALHDRLLAAVRALNVALQRREDWPPMLRRRAQEISDELSNHGTPEQAIASMDLPLARRLAERILHLYADCQAASSTDRS